MNVIFTTLKLRIENVIHPKKEINTQSVFNITILQFYFIVIYFF